MSEDSEEWRRHLARAAAESLRTGAGLLERRGTMQLSPRSTAALVLMLRDLANAADEHAADEPIVGNVSLCHGEHLALDFVRTLAPISDGPQPPSSIGPNDHRPAAAADQP